MAFKLVGNNSGHVNIALGNVTGDFSVKFFGLNIPNLDANQALLGNNTDSSSQFYLKDVNTVGLRYTSTTEMTLSTPIPLNTDFDLEWERIEGITVIKLNGAAVHTSGSVINTLYAMNTLFKCGTRRFGGKCKSAEVQGVVYENTTDDTATTWGTAPLVGLTPPGCWEFYAAGGTVPQGIAEITAITPGETTASVAFTYSDVDATEFDLYIDAVYNSTTTSSPATATGLTASTAYTATIIPVNATGDGTVSAGVGFTTDAPAAVVPQGTVTIGSITVSTTTATVPYTYSAADQTGFEYRVDGGSPVADTASPVDLTGLTASTAYTIEVRAVNATGAGAWSAVGNFTTASVIPTMVFGADKAMSFNTEGLRPNLTGLSVDLYDVTTRELVLSVTGHTTGANAVPADIQNAALSAATEYRIVILAPDGSEAVFRESTQ